MNTSNIIGQSPLIASMERILASGRIVHAYYSQVLPVPVKDYEQPFCSSTAVHQYKTTLYTCRTCRQFASGNHPDVFWVRRQEDKTAIVVDQIQDLQAAIKVKNLSGG